MTRARRMSASTLSLLTLLVTVGVTLSTQVTTTAGERCSRAAGPVRSAPGTGKTVALTFDDGPTAFTPQVLRILRNNNVRATFFMTGRHAAARPKILQQVADEGHLVAGHTFDHDYPGQVSGGWTRSYVADQFDRTNQVLSTGTNKPICFFRPPGGYQTSGMYDAARAIGTAVVMWSIDSEDWKQPGRTTAAATQRIVGRATAGGAQTHPLVLFHDGKASHELESQVSSNRSNTVAALPRVIAYYRAHGYRFVDLAGGSGLPPETTTMRVSASPTRVPARTDSVLTGSVTATTGPVAHRVVTWFSRPVGSGTWVRRGAIDTSASGGFGLSVRPVTDTEYRFELAASARYRTTTERAMVSTYTVATSVVITGETEITSGDSVTLHITVTSDGRPRAGATVAITRAGENGIVTDRVTSDAAGHATFVDQPTATTHYAMTVPKRLPYESGSGVRDVAVTPAPAPAPQ
ncbi:polysaccharide deacetylase family protein [Nocardioides mesophilus]|uniref:Polysaccharide deacetylase family protein n=1 Tax=Nocardioides mesophilus TaxID=433659 RepID=A0A7G9RD60_9ACTN|nr:polysaccharide deacetylase family protein [Nocardioides mesophilus]QNN53535.1 polysaccharide deacetylase family protein [Nocardioides mesophilus]